MFSFASGAAALAADIANPQIILFLHRGRPPPPSLLDREKNDTRWVDGQLVSRDTTQVGSLTPVSGEFKEDGRVRGGEGGRGG